MSETLSGVTQLNIRDFCLFVYTCVDIVCVSICTLTLIHIITLILT